MDYGHAALQQFPKSQRYVLAARIDSSMVAALELILRANLRHHKKTTLADLDTELHVLRHLVRLAHRRRYIDTRRYENWARHLDEVGRLVGGWIKWAKGSVS